MENFSISKQLDASILKPMPGFDIPSMFQKASLQYISCPFFSLFPLILLLLYLQSNGHWWFSFSSCCCLSSPEIPYHTLITVNESKNLLVCSAFETNRTCGLFHTEIWYLHEI